MKKIGLLIDTLIGGGAEKFTLNFAETFTKLGHEVHIILIKNIIEHEVDENLYKIHCLSENGELSKYKFINKYKLAKKLQEKIQEIEKNSKKFDLFISNSEDMDRLSVKIGLPNLYIRYRNSMYEYYKSKFSQKKGIKRLIRKIKFKRMFQKIYSNQNIITVSQALEKEIIEKMDIKPKFIKTIYNPLDFEKIRALSKEIISLPSKPYIICVAKYENRKDQLTLLRAYKKANPKEDLILMGGTYTKSDLQYLEELKILITTLDLSKKVHLYDFQQNPYPWIKNAKLLVLSSKSEGFGAVLAEGLILGTKIVSTNCSCGPSEILSGNLQEFLSPIEDVNKLAENIKKALTNYPNVNQSTLDKFKAEYSVNQYLELI